MGAANRSMDSTTASTAPSTDVGYLEQTNGARGEPMLSDSCAQQDTVGNFPGPLAMLRQGIGLATDLYDVSIVNAIRPEFEACYGKLSPWDNGAITSASHLGAIVGQLLFGVLADKLGRRGTFIGTAGLMFFAALGAALTVPIGSLSAAHVMMFFRFLLGIGIGGEYPLSGAVTAESAPPHKSATHMAAVLLCFLAGQILSATVVLICLYTGASAQVTWRVGIGGGSVLALIGFSVRLSTMKESQAWLESRALTQRQSIFQNYSTFSALARPLAGTFFAWLVYDIVGYGTGGYTTTIFKSSTREGTLWNVLLIVALSTPGYFFTLCVGRFGRRLFQLVGFLGMSIAFFMMGQTYGHIMIFVGVLIFGVQKSFDAFGPGAMTFMIPAEIFPTAVRASCHGISAAGGKLGAFIGTFLLPPFQEAFGVPALLFTCSVLSLLGVLLTMVLTPPYDGDTLQNLRVATKSDLSRTTQILWTRNLARGPPL
mmetsp:Transcript_8059/g.15090  ORF Transcript_8059/g.15090 Transcript_8059/m.15090 type:complete len:484 (+) Transcript_8059:41-1492(+)